MGKLSSIINMVLNVPLRLFGRTSILAVIKDSKIDPKASVGRFTRFYESSIDAYSYVGGGCIIVMTSIGKYCSIAQNCIIGGANHPMDWVSTSPVFHKGGNVLKKNFAELDYEAFGETIIGNDVWIGEGALIKTGVKVGDGAVIGARAVVTNDVEAYSIVAGVPAREIRKRLSKDDIDFIRGLEWWNWSDERVSRYSGLFDNIGELKKEIGKDKSDLA